MGRDLPGGTVTFLFTDVEGSTRLLHALGAEGYAEALAAHRRTLREAFARHGGVEVDTQGDAFFVAFPTAPGALAAATEATAALSGGPIKVRIGLHTGSPIVTDEGYIGPDVHKGARIAAAGHGGQILVSAATAQLVDGATLRDLGLHRLKDLTAPERIYQLGGEDHPPLKTLHQTNLPIPATPFLGRESEVAEIVGHLARDDVRLLTLTGPGGTGKTRLALQAAASAADAYAGGVWWVPLAPLRDPQLVLETAASALGAGGDLAEYIGDKELLLLLDNFEHLVEAAADLGPLLARCPKLSLMVTSREPLHLDGEWEYAVDPLRRTEAVELFLTRAVAVRRDFTANGEVAEICERLDNLPLAIELAAARVKLLSPRVLLERLEQRLPLLSGGSRDAPDRQRTLRATIEWSHELLTPDEQRLFARLAVFRGGCTLETAEAVVEADLDTLQSLVDKSLVRVRADSGRFWMLETIREFAVERLEASGEADEVRRRHADHFLALAEEAEPHVHHDSLEWLDRLQAEHDNLRGALDHMEAQGDGAGVIRLAGALWRFWYQKSHFIEGRRRLETALHSDDRPIDARAKALHGASVMTLTLGDTSSSRLYAEQALALEETLGNRWGVAYAGMMLGNNLAEAPDVSRDLAAARDRLQESARLFEEIGDQHYALISRHNQAWITGDLGDRDGERRLHEESLAKARSLGNQGIEAEALAQLGMLARDDGRLEDAAAMIRQAIRLDHQRGMVLNIATDIGRLASVLVRFDQPERAATLVASSEALTGGLGVDVAWWADERNIETMELATAKLPQTVLDNALAAGRRLTVDEAVALALEDAEP
ncbi:MAG: adenylate/guanylate cyclase domain-containing protein [Chloroflexi bacterium]|nr:adenylate/guanylate cyclase domain-containing protein [Chloroflexota bacterium]